MIGIKGTGIYLPDRRHSNFDRLEKFDMTEDFVRDKIGFTNLASKEPGQETSDLCMLAWEDLKRSHPISPDVVDCLVVCSQNPDGHGLPHTSAIVHEKLGLSENCASFDISLGCSGFVYGLSVIQSFMETNGLKNGLFFTADPYSKVIDRDDKKTATLFGDGAAVTWIGLEPRFRTGHFVFGSNGKKHEGIIVRDNGILEMNGRAVFTFSVRVVPKNILEMLEKNQLKAEQIDLFLLHQGSLHIVNSIADALGVAREKCPFHSAEYGNTVSSSIPMLLHREFDNPNMKTTVISGFGVGLSWASTILYRI